MSKTSKVAAAQLTPVFLNKEKTVDKACMAIKEAAENGAELIVFPEAFISGYPDWVWSIPNNKNAQLNALYVTLVENAVSIPDATTDRLCKAAKSAGINVVMGMNETNSEKNYFVKRWLLFTAAMIALFIFLPFVLWFLFDSDVGMDGLMTFTRIILIITAFFIPIAFKNIISIFWFGIWYM